MTLTALELKLWHKRWFPDYDGGPFENGPKQVVHPNFFLMASTFDIRGGPMNNKNLVSDCPGGGGGCTVTLSGPWTICRSWLCRYVGNLRENYIISHESLTFVIHLFTFLQFTNNLHTTNALPDLLWFRCLTSSLHLLTGSNNLYTHFSTTVPHAWGRGCKIEEYIIIQFQFKGYLLSTKHDKNYNIIQRE